MASILWIKRVGILTGIGSLLLAGITGYSQNKGQKQLRPLPQSIGAISEGLQLSIEAENGMSSSGEPILVTLVLKNLSAEGRLVIGASPYKIYKFTVKDDKGADAPLTEFGQELAKGVDYLERFAFTLAPGQERREQIEINKLFEIAAPGTYSVTAKRTVSKLNSEGVNELVSNTIDVKVSN